MTQRTHQKSAIGALLLTILVAVTIAFNEGMYLLRQRNDTYALRHKNNRAESEVQKRKKDLQTLRENQPAIAATFTRLSASFATEDAAMVFPALSQVGITPTQDPSNPNSKDTVRFQFRSEEVEFHRLVPALTTLENQQPLLRFVSLTLSVASPFRAVATPLRAEGTFEIRKAPSNQ